MILDKALILKGLGGLTAVGGSAAAVCFGISSLGGDSDAKALKKDLGLPSDCNLPSTETTTCSNITKDQLKAIKFEGKGEGDVTIENGSTPSITLKITKTTDDTTYPHGGYKFVFETTQNNITIPKTTTNESIYIKKGTNTEFKIKKVDKNLTLEKAWTVTELAKQVGLTCTGESTCTPGDTIKGYKNGETTKMDATVGESGKSKTISVAKDEENYNQGFKFTLSEDIDLQGESSEKIVTGSYEIKEETGKWYLIKKD